MAVEDIEMIPVRSSNVAAIGYDDETATLVIQFLDESVYYYYDVPEDTFHQFVLAPSKGKFVWREIRDVFDYERVA